MDNPLPSHSTLDECREHLCQNVQPTQMPFVSASGTKVTDISGNEYLDFSSQTLNLNLGQCHPRIVDTVVDQVETLQYTSSRYLDEPTLRLAEELVGLAPEGLTKVNPKMTGGSLANECAIKMARKYHGKKTVVTTLGSFFGETCEAMQTSGKYIDAEFLTSGDTFTHITPPYESDTTVEDAIEEFRELLEERDDIAGFLLTPIDVNAGVVEFPEAYLREIRRLCDEHDVALIFDEVQTGFGWLGDMFAADYYDVTPDILTVAKGISAGFPLGAVLCREEYDVITYGEHEFTYGAHTVSCAAALENLAILTEDGFLDEIRSKGKYLERQLNELSSFECVDDIRCFGLIGGVDFVVGNDEENVEFAQDVLEECRDQGVIFRLSGDFGGNSLVVKPPVVVSRDEIDAAMETLQSVLDDSTV